MLPNKLPATFPLADDAYDLVVVASPENCDQPEKLPLELRYILQTHPEYKDQIKASLSKGEIIGVRTLRRAPANMLAAVHAISTFSQRNFILNWLPELLRDKHYPVIAAQDEVAARRMGVELADAVKTLLDGHLRFKEIVVFTAEKGKKAFLERALADELTEYLYPLQIDHAIYRLVADNATERTAIAQNIVKALVIIGPIAHVLEKFAAGIGKVFAAFSDDLLGEAAELSALHGSGFSWRELLKRSKILIPVLLIATYGAYSVEGLLNSGHLIVGGVIYGLSAVALSLTTALQSFFLYRRNALQLHSEGKTTVAKNKLSALALRQDFTNPARLGLFIGAAFAPLMGILGSYLGWMHNGWVLAGIGSTESIVAGLTVIFAARISEWRFHQRLRRFIQKG